jgi:hypothetical protein
MPEKTDSTAAALRALSQLSDSDLATVLKAIELSPAVERAGYTVIPQETFHCLTFEVPLKLLRALRVLLGGLDKQANKTRRYRRGPAVRKSRRERRDLHIAEALANGIAQPEQILRFILDVDPESATNSKGAPIRADSMMWNFRHRHRS